MLQSSPGLFGGTPGLEPVALRIARINEDLGELQEQSWCVVAAGFGFFTNN